MCVEIYIHEICTYGDRIRNMRLRLVWSVGRLILPLIRHFRLDSFFGIWFNRRCEIVGDTVYIRAIQTRYGDISRWLCRFIHSYLIVKISQPERKEQQSQGFMHATSFRARARQLHTYDGMGQNARSQMIWTWELHAQYVYIYIFLLFFSIVRSRQILSSGSCPFV